MFPYKQVETAGFPTQTFLDIGFLNLNAERTVSLQKKRVLHKAAWHGLVLGWLKIWAKIIREKSSKFYTVVLQTL